MEFGAKVTELASRGNRNEDFTLRQLALLREVTVNQCHASVKVYAERLNVVKPVITRACDRLEKLGLVRRIPDPNDARMIIIRPTAKGIAFAATLFE